ncbi:hypothetical protein BCR33DRAFT_787903 [Rhizoclosmatium globosum]|uniref:Uncharacterized protein n=1 Tax=Rhizoclosmatium globosum TaxID=329046 RepID=A0A1Y2BYV5_9FUNG|nr:hypothetical protein BCR33DRAFT_787903 [Rhizoclosmatium globosum]|eukprot:ORY39941.1 hypothetical protein BCR33DRAFT_787903 [Rhizoclosmatium globosum]
MATDDSSSVFSLDGFDDDLFSDASTAPPRHVTVSSYPLPLAKDGLFVSEAADEALKNMDSSSFAAIFNGNKLNPSNIQSLVEREFMLGKYQSATAIARSWLAENRKRDKKFACLEICDIAARSEVRLGNLESALDILEALLKKLGFYARALNQLPHYLKVRARDYRAFIEASEILVLSQPSSPLISALAMREAKWLLEITIQPNLLENPVFQLYKHKDFSRIAAFVESHKAILDEFDTSTTDETQSKNKLMESLESAVPGLSTDILTWIRETLIHKISSRSADSSVLNDEDDDGPSVSQM